MTLHACAPVSISESVIHTVLVVVQQSPGSQACTQSYGKAQDT